MAGGHPLQPDVHTCRLIWKQGSVTSSKTRDCSSARSNERLEFLGDRVLGLVAAEALHALYPEDSEGALALKFNALARQEACAAAAEAAGIGDHIRLANSEVVSGGRHKAAILAGTCEAVIAALYLDG